MADVPDRHEFGTGEINYPAVAAVLRETGYGGTVALEAFARNDSDSAVDASTWVFTPEAE